MERWRFAYKLKYVIEIAHKLIDFTDYQDLFAKYATLPKISFDYAVVEKEDKIQVQRFAGQWKDFGTWNTLTEAMEDAVVGKGILNDNCINVHIVNEMEIPILAMGLHDLVISGKGKTIIDGVEQFIKVGDVVTMPAGCCHMVTAQTELKMIEIQLGSEINVHDKQKVKL